ncbi:MAG: asparagine--tRNA ligase [Phycisphaeraceae bacterium]|nr:asparagine--tRNA ligase [Phycisphaeraceae bacterium]MCW5754295.1 asparagine--tRNA ligase [Phycisphaeraceae bacterium]
MAWLRVVEALRAPLGTTITVKGWVRTRRDSKAEGGMSFVAVHDGTCFDAIQAVVKSNLSNYASEVAKLTTHCAVEIDGVIVQNPKGGNEIAVDAAQGGAVRVVGWVEDPDTYPIQPKPHSFEYLREVAHLRVRTNTFGAVARVRHSLAAATHRFFDERGFFYVHTPIITASDCEGAGQMFRVSTLDLCNLPRKTDDASSRREGEAGRTKGLATGEPETSIDYSQDFFGKESHLTVSGQLNVETYCQALSRVYTFGPTFRAENSNTSRHLAEFWMIEPEIAFADLHADADLAESYVKYMIDAVLRERADDMQFFDTRIEKGLLARLKHVLDTPFRRLPYTEAIKILEKAIAGGRKFEYPIGWGSDLQSEHERYLTEEHFKQPVILMNYPKAIKAFYMRLNDPGTDGAPEETVAAMDVLVPGIGELVGGSQREERLEVLDRRIDEMGLPKHEYWWYRDLRRYGTVPHAGFGLGFERMMLFVTGMQNIRDVIPFPRAPKQAEF